MSKANEPAFPNQNYDGPLEGGLTKREYFAAKAMQGMIATITCSRWEDNVIAGVVPAAVQYADALLAELEKSRPAEYKHADSGLRPEGQ